MKKLKIVNYKRFLILWLIVILVFSGVSYVIFGKNKNKGSNETKKENNISNLVEVKNTQIKEAGFICAFTTKYGKVYPGSNPLLLPRVRILKDMTLNSFEKSL